MNIFTPKAFLQWAGYILVVVGIIGFFFLIGPDANRSIFGSIWYFDNAENWAHLILGIIALIGVYGVKSEAQQKGLAMIFGIVALVIGVIGFFLPTGGYFLGAYLQNPLDNILHVVIGLWGLAASMKKEGSMAPVGGSVT